MCQELYCSTYVGARYNEEDVGVRMDKVIGIDQIHIIFLLQLKLQLTPPCVYMIEYVSKNMARLSS